MSFHQIKWFWWEEKIWHEPIVLACSSFNNSVPMRIQFHSVHWSQKKCSQSSILASSAQLKPNWWTELVLNSIPPATGQPTRASRIVLSSFHWALLRKHKSKNAWWKWEDRAVLFKPKLIVYIRRSQKFFKPDPNPINSPEGQKKGLTGGWIKRYGCASKARTIVYSYKIDQSS